MLDFFPQAFAAPYTTGSGSDSTMGIVLSLVMIVWYVLWIVQSILGFGTAYRKTKANGDNGVSLFGWMILYSSLASIVPGLGIYLWKKSKESSAPTNQPPTQYY